jgi:hypothetical protein
MKRLTKQTSLIRHFPKETPMPHYRIVRMQNERSATNFEFDAAGDEEAFRLLRDETCLDALLESSSEPDSIEPDVYDEIRGLDRLEDGAFVMLVDEHCLKNQMPYSFEARDFAAKVAALGEEGAYDDAIETLEALIAEARALCGIELSTS